MQVSKKTRQKLAQAHDLFYAVFDANPIPTVLTRQEDEIFLYANAEFLNYFQVDAGQVIGRKASEFSFNLGLPGNRAEELRRQLRKAGSIRNVEFEIRHPSGETRIILASLQVLLLDETNALITTFIDITNQVRDAEQIRSLASELTAAEQAERHRLSQILHDDLQQRIFAVQMQLSFLRDAYEKNDLKSFPVNFKQLDEWLTEAIQVTRKLSVDLSPPILHGEGLVNAVIWLASQMEEQYGLKVSIESTGQPVELDEKVRVLVFYALRELLFNIVKHAGTLEAGVRFEHSDSHLLASVKDHGIGFNTSEVLSSPSNAHGLLLIRHRLNLLGCSMEVHSQAANGTEVIIEVPYERRDS